MAEARKGKAVQKGNTQGCVSMRPNVGEKEFSEQEAERRTALWDSRPER